MPKVKGPSRWTYKRKTEIVLGLLKNSLSIVDICRQYDLKQSEVQSWVDTFLAFGVQGLKAPSKTEESISNKELLALRAKVGELYLELEARKKLEAIISRREMNS